MAEVIPYLAQCLVKVGQWKALNSLLEGQPSDPIKFLAEMF